MQKFGERYFVVRYRMPLEDWQEKTFRSEIKAADFQNQMQRKGCETVFSIRDI